MKHFPAMSTPSAPSRNRTDDWLYAFAPEQMASGVTDVFVGKWLVFVSRSGVDAVWSRIADGTTRGVLGFEAKVSTAVPSGYGDARHVICVYTADYRNRDDVSRVLAGLRSLGMRGKLYYKTDAATLEGTYASGGPFTRRKGRASLYCSDDFGV